MEQRILKKTKQWAFSVFLFLGFFLASQPTMGQGVGINNDSTDPDSSAILDVKSVDKGFLAPRMTMVQRDAISGPATGLWVYQTDSTSGFYYFDGTNWVAAKGGGAFVTTSGVTSNSPGTLGSDDFVFGSSSLDDLPGGADNERMFFDKGNGAFRAGASLASEWNTTSRGPFSTAFGFANTAIGPGTMAWGAFDSAANFLSTAWGLGVLSSGYNSTAFGFETKATGDLSVGWGEGNIVSGAVATAWGKQNTASGIGSTVLGETNTAGGVNSIAWGNNNNATGKEATAFGNTNTASGNESTAWGNSNVASGIQSTTYGAQNTATNNRSTAWGRFNNSTGIEATAFGNTTTASGNISTAAGLNSVASGTASFSLGSFNFARSFAEIAVGLNCTDYTPANVNGFSASDRVFVVGNGINPSARSDAFTVFKNGNATLAGTLTQNSDRRLKTNITRLSSALENVRQLGGYTYNWKDENRDAGTQIGVIAQEVQALYPELVGEDGNGFLTVNYTGLVPVLIEAVKELEDVVKTQNDELAQMKANYASMQDQLNAIQASLDNQATSNQLTAESK